MIKGTFFRENRALQDVGNGSKWKNEPFATSIFLEKGTLGHFLGFVFFLRDKGYLNKKSERWPTCIFCMFFHFFFSFGTIYNIVQCTVFPEWYPRSFFVILIFKGKGPLNKNRKDDPYAFWRSFIWEHLQLRAMHRFPEKRDPRSFLRGFSYVFFFGGRVRFFW